MVENSTACLYTSDRHNPAHIYLQGLAKAELAELRGDSGRLCTRAGDTSFGVGFANERPDDEVLPELRPLLDEFHKKSAPFAHLQPGIRVYTEFGGSGHLLRQHPDGKWTVHYDDGDLDVELPEHIMADRAVVDIDDDTSITTAPVGASVNVRETSQKDGLSWSDMEEDGSRQKYGTDYADALSPVANATSIRLQLATAVHSNYYLD